MVEYSFKSNKDILKILCFFSKPLDLKSLMAMLTSLTDGAKKLDKSDMQRNWLDRVKNLFPLIHRLLDGVRIADDHKDIQEQIGKCW